MKAKSGNTTRLADKYIQDIFSNRSPVKIGDHFVGRTIGERNRANKNLIAIIVRRLKFEHPSDQFIVDTKKQTIQKLP